MYKYVIKRLLLMIPVLLGISFAVFFLMNLTPGTPADIIMGELATPEAKEAMNESLGWNQPFLKRYLDYIVGVFQGDFGNSYVSGLSVMKELFTRFPTTFRLALYSMVLAAVVGIPVGVACAVKQYSLMDSFSTVFALVFVSIPSFWLGLLMIILFSVKLHWLPAYGSESFIQFIMPAITCSAATLATLIRMTRSTMLEVIRQDYIRTAYAKGASKGRVIVKHALQNAMIPIITIVGVILCAAGLSFVGLGVMPPTPEWGAILTEGKEVIRTAPHIVVFPGVAIMLAVMSLNFLGDGLRDALDPRLKQ